MLAVTFLPLAGVREFARTALLTPTTFRSAALSIACPAACIATGLTGDDFDPAILTLVIATPAAFSINAAYLRRERALESLASIRAASWSLHRSVERWGTPELAEEVQGALGRVYTSFIYAAAHGGHEKAIDELYSQIESLGVALEEVRLHPSPQFAKDGAGPTLASQLYSDERLLVQNIEQVRLVAETRTPALLRGIIVGGSTIFPVIFAPYFASIALQSPGFPWAAYLLSLLFAVANGALVNIQEALENPFDGDTEDDIELGAYALTLPGAMCDMCAGPEDPADTVDGDAALSQRVKAR